MRLQLHNNTILCMGSESTRTNKKNKKKWQITFISHKNLIPKPLRSNLNHNQDCWLAGILFVPVDYLKFYGTTTFLQTDIFAYHIANKLLTCMMQSYMCYYDSAIISCPSFWLLWHENFYVNCYTSYETIIQHCNMYIAERCSRMQETVHLDRIKRERLCLPLTTLTCTVVYIHIFTTSDSMHWWV